MSNPPFPSARLGVGWLLAAAGWMPYAVQADAGAGALLAQQGNASVAACISCHGQHGEGLASAGYPRLAGQPQAYLAKQLQDFASGRRANPVMKPVASALSAAQINDLTAYFASLPAWKSSGAAPATQPYRAGATLAVRGNWDVGVPACFACHGAGGSGIPPHFPALAGQPASYVRAQLAAWQAGTRNNDPQGLMKAVASRMSAAEIDAVSAYFENPQAAPQGAQP